MKLIRTIIRFCADEYGVGSIYMLLLLPLFLMIAGLGVDGALAFRTHDMLQSTADASALGAALQLPTSGTATNGQTTSAIAAAFNYAKKNMSVAGFGNVLNTAADGITNTDIEFGNWNGSAFTPAPPSSAGNAIQITVRTATVNNNAYPTSFLALVGKTSWDINALAVAMIGKPTPLCLIAYGSLTIGGSGNTNLGGCTIETFGDMTCNLSSSATQPDYGLAGGLDGTNGSGTNYCGSKGHFSHVPTSSISDPYASLAANIVNFTCASYPLNSWTTAAAGNYCGNVQLQNDVTISGGGTVEIKNGSLDTNGHTLTVTNGTIIFTGDNSCSCQHNIIDTSNGSGIGSITIAAPTTGVWTGIALYQDPTLTSGIDVPISPSNKMPNLNINGVVYTRNANWTYNGNENSGGTSCLVLVANNISIVGTGDVIAQKACAPSPTTLIPISLLVQ